MRTMHVRLRAAAREGSIAFDTSVSYEVLGGVPATDLGASTVRVLPGDEFGALELVRDLDNRIEFVQRPGGHPDGTTRSDPADPGQSR
jgi:hypothetical protein